ncbi:MAG: SRPBCC family protein [Rhodocyclaceae bacterium]|nr:SRPBCC family protein [Rhodocyclaceae bacterium]
MDSYDFQLVSEWFLPHPSTQVWEALRTPPQWPRWWRNVELAEQIACGQDDGVGNRYRLCWKSGAPYRLRFVSTVIAVDTGRRILARIDGDLCGRGEWILLPEGGATRVRYVWQVSLTPRWMRLALPLLRRLFIRNHDRVMDQGCAGLRAHLAARTGLD